MIFGVKTRSDYVAEIAHLEREIIAWKTIAAAKETALHDLREEIENGKVIHCKARHEAEECAGRLSRVIELVRAMNQWRPNVAEDS
jgi:hypothetical protein